MKATWTVVLLSGLLGACVPTAPTAPPPAQPTSSLAPPAAAAAPTYESRPVAIRNVTCGALLNAAEDDREAASMFFIGYTAARQKRTKIDVAELDGLEAAALGYCAAHPDRPAAVAFMRSFSEHGW